MEDNPCESIQNNVLGTKILADLSVKYGVRRFVMVSTDKAVNPTNVMGCSKRICEVYVQSLNKAERDGVVKGQTQFITTRFGNVLGSNGSVIPIFERQIKAGGPVTVTDPNIIRYFMLIPEACELVLEAGTKGEGGEIFVFDMGQAGAHRRPGASHDRAEQGEGRGDQVHRPEGRGEALRGGPERVGGDEAVVPRKDPHRLCP